MKGGLQLNPVYIFDWHQSDCGAPMLGKCVVDFRKEILDLHSICQQVLAYFTVTLTFVDFNKKKLELVLSITTNNCI